MSSSVARESSNTLSNASNLYNNNTNDESNGKHMSLVQKGRQIPNHLLTPLSQRLSNDLQDSSITPQILKTFLTGFLAFQNEWLGPHSPKPRPWTKIPIHFFLDHTVSGSLSVIVRALYHMNPPRRLAELDFSSMSNSESSSIFRAIYDSLIKSNLWKIPKIFIDTSIQDSSIRKQLEGIIREHQAILAPREHATHIIVSSSKSPHDHEHSHNIYIRPIEKRLSSSEVLVHWWYKPDSQDSWINESEVAHWNHLIDSSSVRPSNSGSHIVTDRFLLDLDHWNEWMNEMDYEASNLVPHPTKTPIFVSNSKKRSFDMIGNDMNGEPNTKRIKTEEVDTEPVNSINPISMPSNKHFKKDSSYSTLATFPNQKSANISNAYGLVVQGHTSTSNSSNSMTGAGPNTRDSPLPSLVLPNHLSWFDISQIHDIEKTALPEFFEERQARSSNKTPEIYREYRDFMIHAYQQNPAQYLNYTSCRRSLAGDSCAVLRVFDFLEQTGLINYAINPDTQGIFPPPAPVPPPSETARQLLQLDNPNSLSPLFSVSSQDTSSEETLPLRNFIAHASQKGSTTAFKPSKCFSCGQNTTYLGYANKNATHSNLCPDCFAQGNYATNSSSSDYEKYDLRFAKVAQDDTQNFWSDAETLRLLEGLEMYGEDWDKVVAHVRTKDKESCILQFIRMPIEDPYMHGSTLMDKSYKDLQSSGNVSAPFGHTPNPILTLVTYLTQAVSPQVAAAASQAALKKYMEMEQENGRLMPVKKENASLDETQTSEMDIDQKDMPNPSQSEPVEKDKFFDDIAAVSSAALAAATLKATLLAEKEEREIRKLVHQIVEAQMEKIELKIKYFDEMEKFLQLEHQKMETSRNQLYTERLKLLEDQKKAAEMMKQAQEAQELATQAMMDYSTPAQPVLDIMSLE